MTLIQLLCIKLLILISINAYSQCGVYLDNKYAADSCFRLKLYSKSADYYEKCLTCKEKKRIDYYYASYCNIKINRLKVALEYLGIAASEGLYYKKLQDFYTDTLFQTYYRSYAKWKKIGEKIKASTIAFEKKIVIDSALVKNLLARKIEDQKYRGTHLSSTQLNSDSLWATQKKIDAANQQWLAEEISKNGWPGIFRAGEAGDNAAWLIVQHADNDTTFQKNCLTLLKKIAVNGETNIRNIAYLEDRILINTHQEQVYGTQFENVLQDGKNR